MDGIIAVTYRCNARCVMCHTWKHPSERHAEIHAADLAGLPEMARVNITGGEPFLKEDLADILAVVKKKARRVVISSHGFLTKRTLDIMKEHRDVGIRISFDGIGETHDRIRGVKGAHQRALDTLVGLKDLGIKDLGMAVTVSDDNARELVPLFHLARAHGVELATAILHNAYYFHKHDNAIVDPDEVEHGLKNLIDEYLQSPSPKDWFRAYFTNGLVGYLRGSERALKCTMAQDSFFIDPYGDIRPCNVMDAPFGNIKQRPFGEIWAGSAAAEARRKVAACDRNCWMIGSVGHLMRKQLHKPMVWIGRNKLGARGRRRCPQCA